MIPMKTSCFRVFALFAALMLGTVAVTVRAEDLGAVKARMHQRLPQLDQLKESGAIGENNQGFVEVRSGADAAAVVAAENQDRKVVYAAIAQKTGSTPDRVGHYRARKIVAASAPGVWLQREDGSWYKK
jgi:uncharacterized protein